MATRDTMISSTTSAIKSRNAAVRHNCLQTIWIYSRSLNVQIVNTTHDCMMMTWFSDYRCCWNASFPGYPITCVTADNSSQSQSLCTLLAIFSCNAGSVERIEKHPEVIVITNRTTCLWFVLLKKSNRLTRIKPPITTATKMMERTTNTAMATRSKGGFCFACIIGLLFNSCK